MLITAVATPVRALAANPLRALLGATKSRSASISIWWSRLVPMKAPLRA